MIDKSMTWVVGRAVQPYIFPLFAVLLCAGCGSAQSAPEAGVGQTAPVTSAQKPSTTVAPDATASPEVGGEAPRREANPTCTGLGCRLFDSPEQALSYVLEKQPLVLGVGEAHAQKGTEGIESTTARFTHQLLPFLAPKSSDLVIELMEPDRRCLKTTEKVREEQKQVTQSQASSNQNEFLTLGTQAKNAGVTPHILYPNCAEYQRIVDAGENSIFVMLETIAALTDQKTRAILERNQKSGLERTVLLYGGAVHNDAAPRPGRETWSYGPSLIQFTGERYLELDLIVREYIKDSEVWRAQPWYAHFDKSQHRDKVVLYQPGPYAFVLIFPASS